MSFLYGFDASSWQGNINLDNARIDFGIIKATEGIDYFNPFYTEQIGALRKDNDLVGHYHFAHPELNSPELEAQFFLSKIDIKQTDVVILDWETTYPGDIDQWCFSFLEAVKNKLNGLKGGLYLNKSEETGRSWAKCVNGGYFLMLADYDNTGTANPWSVMAMQQTKSTGSINGIAGDVDLDTFFGDRAAWDKYGFIPASTQPIADAKDQIINQLNQQVTDLNRKITDLTKQVTDMNAEIANGKGLLDSMTKQVSMAQQDENNIKTQLQDTQTQMQRQIDTLQALVDKYSTYKDEVGKYDDLKMHYDQISRDNVLQMQQILLLQDELKQLNSGVAVKTLSDYSGRELLGEAIKKLLHKLHLR